MRETPDDLAELESLLDRSYALAGEHLRSITTPERRLDAEALCQALTGMSLLVLATSTEDGRPICGPVDGIFYRGRFWFGSAPDSVRFRHIRSRPDVSATHLPGEHLAVTVHGTAHEVDPWDPGNAGFVECCREIYPGWDEWWAEDGPLKGAVYARIDPRRMFTFRMDPDAVSNA